MVDEEALFEHMQELLDRLPQMKAVGERVRLGKAAVPAMQAVRRREEARKVLALVEADLAAVQEALEAARSAGDEAECDRLVREVLYLGDRLGLARGPVNDASFRLGLALKEGGFADEAAAMAAAVEPAELAALEAQVEEYRRDYDATLAACQACEAE